MSQPKIIVITNPKGGVGKTNTTRTIAKGISLAGFNVVIGETDPQKSLQEWNLQCKENSNPEVFDFNANSESALRKSLDELIHFLDNIDDRDLDYIVIDGCAFDFRFLNSTLNVADLVIIPTQASPDDICQLGEVIELTHAIQLKRTAKKAQPLIARTLINKARLETALLKESKELLKNPNETGILCFNTIIRDYEAIRRAAGKGKTAFECGNKKAKADAQYLTDEILRLLK